ncbi:MAG: hypothetical protein SGJ23_05460 [Alphaproteobacteria bacterium]|nr:hypothetical protein [Alphaproteobacteria bacterium]
MELDDLKAEWRARDAVLARELKQQSAMMRDGLVERRLERIRRRGAMGPFGLAVHIAFLAGFGLYLADNWGRWEFFAPGLLLMIWTIVMGALTIGEQQQLRAVDFGAPVLEIQQKLARLGAARARAFQWAFLTGQILWWIPFFVVVMWGVFDVDLYRASDFMPRFMAINIGVGLVLVPVLLWVAHLVGPRLAASATGRSVLDSVMGRDLAEARALAQRLARFEAEAA